MGAGKQQGARVGKPRLSVECDVIFYGDAAFFVLNFFGPRQSDTSACVSNFI